ncbi:hypothetical protein [Lysinibacillus sp. NPDC059133]|uniref:hypothetical protein n=1 Tax=Lysinibacillus sp. NPDC059133 TaxID=3346737 RepID=UPI0036D0B3DE
MPIFDPTVNIHVYYSFYTKDICGQSDPIGSQNETCIATKYEQNVAKEYPFALILLAIEEWNLEKNTNL